jgi:hypothetical protein
MSRRASKLERDAQYDTCGVHGNEFHVLNGCQWCANPTDARSVASEANGLVRSLWYYIENGDELTTEKFFLLRERVRNYYGNAERK